MEQFHDSHHVRLRSCSHGLYLLADADADGESRIFLHSVRATVCAASAVHMLRYFDGYMIMLHSAANGRYLATTTGLEARIGLGGNRVTQLDLNRPLFAVGWFAIMSRSGSGTTSCLVTPAPPSTCPTATIAWVVEAIPPRDHMPRLRNPKEFLKQHNMCLSSIRLVDESGVAMILGIAGSCCCTRDEYYEIDDEDGERCGEEEGMGTEIDTESI
ncbi:hypothetical protein E2562_011685 [Oryza meyeriana var. granulata]|uniref:DUF569 domain-containing protein n=1 Tax=Oryza meyeriana var. granulata TaxID=110450 RepID=A0A6G1DFT6_9ORYZ|nr:hypothetical protein E2562_011685 [Oryza meyeriana var. granulata]